MKAAHTYDEKLSDYIKTENGGLVAIAVSSVLTTPSNPITGSFINFNMMMRTGCLLKIEAQTILSQLASALIFILFSDDEKQPELQFQLFWLCTNLLLTAILGTLAILKPSYLSTLLDQEHHLFHNNMATGIIMATIFVTGILSFALFFVSIKSGLKSIMEKPARKKEQINEEENG